MPLAAIGGIIFLTISVLRTSARTTTVLSSSWNRTRASNCLRSCERQSILQEKDDIVKEAEKIVLAHPGVDSVFAFAGAGGLNQNTAGASSPKDTIGQIQLETIPGTTEKIIRS